MELCKCVKSPFKHVQVPRGLICGMFFHLLLNFIIQTAVALVILYGCSLSGRCPYTVKPVLNGHLKIVKQRSLMENGSIMKVESIAECS